MKNSLFLFLFLLAATSSRAQELRNGAPRVFLDCQWGCDLPYLKTELSYLSFMRDRADADIFIQQTALINGAGGAHFTLFFYGQRQFAGRNDTLVFDLPPATPDNDARQTLKTQLERGLLPYLLETPLAAQITFSIAPNGTENPDTGAVADPWNFWTISVRGNAYLNGQQVAKSLEVFGNVEATRVTEQHKTSFSAGGDYGRSTFRFDDTLTERYENGGYFFNASEVLSVGDHWSVGFFGGGRQAQYSNLKMSAYFNSGVEYNIFPYREVTRRQLAIRYQVGPQFNRYFDETVYFKREQWLWEQSLSAAYRHVLEWGNFNLGMRSGNYLHHWALYEMNLFGGLELNLFKGFNIHFFGEYGLVRNQVELPSGGATKEEALLRIRQLQTGYNYFMYCGVSYTFGSIYSNVVNPRFD